MHSNKSVIQKAYEAILNDVTLQQLGSARLKIYSLATPIAIVNKNGEIETVWLDNTNHPELEKIEEEIEFRTKQITDFYLKQK